jgi:hypothetical protein
LIRHSSFAIRISQRSSQNQKTSINQHTQRQELGMAKMIAFELEAREAMRRGVSMLARAVKVTLGP